METDFTPFDLRRVFWGVVAAGSLFGLIGLTIYTLLRGGYNIRIEVRGRDVSVHGPVPAALKQDLAHFFANDFPAKEKLTVHARRRPDRGYDLRFSGPVTAGERQQVRNFLMTRR